MMTDPHDQVKLKNEDQYEIGVKTSILLTYKSVELNKLLAISPTEVSLGKVSSDVVDLVKSFLYCRPVVISDRNMKEVRQVALRLGLQELYGLAQDEILKKVNPGNICSVITVWESKDDKLFHSVFDAMRKNYSSLLSDKNFMTIVKSNSVFLQKLLTTVFQNLEI